MSKFLFTLMKKQLGFYFLLLPFLGFSQSDVSLSGTITDGKLPIKQAQLILDQQLKAETDSLGRYAFYNLTSGNHKLSVQADGYTSIKRTVRLGETPQMLNLSLEKDQNLLSEIVVTGTLKSVRRLESPVPVEVYAPAFFKKNPVPNIFDALQNVNGVRPQLNCGVCNTGDIHINGLEGPYTAVLIDGMPIVSSLSTVYGLSGIPNSLVERIEIVKGPASSLYGSEAMGGLINIITKTPFTAPQFSADVLLSSWLETNTDLGLKYHWGKSADALIGVNYFKNSEVVDNDKDGFTDLTLQDRISVFHKVSFNRKNNRVFNIGLRGMYEDRWGGDIRWEKKYRGGDVLYGESIYTKRGELFGNYQLPTVEKLMLSFSGNLHFQDSRYGTTAYIANQKVGFLHLTWDKKINRHEVLTGVASRYTYYDDNTPATASGTLNKAESTWLPGIFIQDEIGLGKKHLLLLGLRYDYNSVHGNIFTPRMAHKFKINDDNILRLNAGTGFRVVNLFTEDHAALTGSREVVIQSRLRPEKTVNANLNYLRKMYVGNGTIVNLETSFFYTRFSNKIIADYTRDPNKIIYDNLSEYSVSQGITANLDVNFRNGVKIIAGATYMDVYTVENNRRERQLLTEKFTGTWSVSYKINPIHLSFDYTGNLYSPMKLPLLGALDPRSPESPWYSIQNIQLTYHGFPNFELYTGIKNLLDFTPMKNNPFLIARTQDPFDKNVSYGTNGQVLATPQNPYALTFDTTYIYAPNQGIRGFFGLRYKLP